MATKTVILVLAVLAAVVAITAAATTKREAPVPVHATFVVPYYKTLPNGEKALDFVGTVVTPVVTATNQALTFTGQLVSTAIGGITGALSAIESILTGGNSTTTTTTTPATGR